MLESPFKIRKMLQKYARVTKTLDYTKLRLNESKEFQTVEISGQILADAKGQKNNKFNYFRPPTSTLKNKELGWALKQQHHK